MRELVGSKNTIGQNGLSVEKAPKSDLYLFLPLPFTSELDLNLRKKLVKCYICSTALYGAEIWTIRKVGQKYQERSEMWCWRMMYKIC